MAMIRRLAALCLVASVLALALGCGGETKKDANKGQDKPVPEEKKDKK